MRVNVNILRLQLYRLYNNSRHIKTAHDPFSGTKICKGLTCLTLSFGPSQTKGTMYHILNWIVTKIATIYTFISHQQRLIGHHWTRTLECKKNMQWNIKLPLLNSVRKRFGPTLPPHELVLALFQLFLRYLYIFVVKPYFASITPKVCCFSTIRSMTDG